VTNGFHPHKIDWDRDKSERFWSYIGSRTVEEAPYFTRQVGASLVSFLKRAGVPLRGEVLDFGCGHGHLLKILAETGARVSGVDFSPTNVEMARHITVGMANIRRVELVSSIPTNLPESFFDTVFFIETIEHLLDNDLIAACIELRRLLRPGGTLVVSTPNAESLELGETICPECGCVFHQMQHVRSWSRESLQGFFLEIGFRPRLVRELHLQSTSIQTWLATMGGRMLRRRMPHLLYVGEKWGRSE